MKKQQRRKTPKYVIEAKKMEWVFNKEKKPPRFFNRYPIIVLLLEPRAGSGVYGFFDRVGRFKKKSGLGFEYRLKKKKKRLPTAQFERLMETNKGKLLVLDHPEEDVFRPAEIETGKISPKETAWKETFMTNVERANILLQRRGFIERYMPLVLLIVFGVMMIMALYVVRTDIASIIVQVQQAVGSATANMRPPLPPGG